MQYLRVAIVCFVVLGCNVGTEPSATPYAPTGRQLSGEPLTPCVIKGDVPVQAESAALCGVLKAPEDRDNPSGRQVALRVAVVPATTADPAPDPLFVLAGGPGEAATQFFAWLPAAYTDVHAERDIVLIDQRGTGESNALTLPEMPDTSGLSDAQADAELVSWASGSIAALDADPRFYTSTVAADDLDDVRSALGYDQINLYGASYGGTLAQYYLRQHGDRVRVAVFDGSTPLDVPVFERMATSSQHAMDLLLTRCADDEQCNAAFPALATEWQALLNLLPATVEDPETGEQAFIDDIAVAKAFHSALLLESTAAQIPLTIHLASQGNWVQAAQILSVPISGGPTLVMSDEIVCSEAWARFDAAEVRRLGEGSYDLSREIALANEREALCRYLPVGLVPADDALGLQTEVPVMWLSGDGDPQDPPENLIGIGAQEPNSLTVVMPAQEHVVGHLGCAPSVIADFLDAGTAEGLDVSCISRGADPAPTFRLE